MSIYTGNGDKGLSSTIKYTDISKSHPVFDILGTIDELMSVIGVAVITANAEVARDLNRIQKQLIDIASEIAGGFPADVEDEIEFLEDRTDMYEGMGIAPTTFKVKGVSETGARVDVARAVARRLERAAVVPHGSDRVREDILIFFNRLSDYLFVLARYCDFYESVSKKVEEGLNDSGAGKTTPETLVKAGGSSIGLGNLSRDTDSITLESAKPLCEAVLMVARKMGLRVVAAVVDSGGNTVSVLRDDDAFIASVDIATNKAWTCVALKMTTEEVGKITADGAGLKGLEDTNNGRIVNFGGGIPLKVGGKIIGGFGVSGGDAEQDTILADAAQRIFDEMIRGGK